jgi:uncharacterized protein YbjT (DUF2867 family)
MAVTGPILIFLPNGVQGSAVVRAALRRGHSVRALSRASAPGKMSLPGVDVAPGDLDQPESLATACAGVAHVVLQVPISGAPTMIRQADNAVSAARQAGVSSIILKLASASRPAPCAEPSFVANAAVEDVVRQSGIAFAIVRPTMYLDNLLKPSARAEIMRDGVFAPPIAAEQSIAWTSADDCAEAAILLLERGRYGGDHRVAGARSVRGHELAARLSVGLDRNITYRAQDLEAFEREVDAAMGPGVGRAVASKFRYFRDHPEDADAILARPYEPTAPLEDFTPTSIEDWARAHAPLLRA